MASSQDRVRDALSSAGIVTEIVEFGCETRTSQQAADAIGCAVAQIAKSLVFKGRQSGQAVLVVASGSNRVCEKKLERLLGEKIGKADADFVREQTGFAIGGVAPVGHVNALRVVVDTDILQYPEMWAAAGTPNSVFRIDPHSLVNVSGGTPADIRQD